MINKNHFYTRIFATSLAICAHTSPLSASEQATGLVNAPVKKSSTGKRSLRSYKLLLAPLVGFAGSNLVAAQSIESSLRGAKNNKLSRALDTAYDSNRDDLEDVNDLVINGDDALANQYKFFTMLTNDYGRRWEWHGCGATLIADNVALTAAHCLDREVPNSAIIGALSPWESDNDGQISVRMRIKDTVIHPRYRPSNNRYDFALLRFENTIGDELANRYGERYRNSIEPIAVAGQDVIDRMNDYDPVTVLGFGRTESGQSASHLQTADIDYISTELCQQYYSPSTISDDMVCASATGQSSCYGDSGGPLIDRFSYAGPVLFGVVSWGRNDGCEGYLPGVYGKTSEALDWIKREACPHVAAGSNTQDAGGLCSSTPDEPRPEPGSVSILSEGPFAPESPIRLRYRDLPPSRTHWVAIYELGASSLEYDNIDWSYLPDTSQSPSGTLQLDGPANAGSYEVRLFLDDSYSVHQIVRFEVEGSQLPPDPSPSITIPSQGPFAPRSMVQVNYQQLPPSTTHWYGIYRRNAPDNDAVSWRYLPSTLQNSDGTIYFRAPRQTGRYQFRAFLSDSWERFEVIDFVVR
ncbi:MAG: serine protease [Oligoflexales bacterium]|nr:serine protease [Oligoflexales bacterium]